ncbi:MAG TPA: hypothetical protein VIN32_02555, partial [Candidatus Limnocylindria bacterium]
RYDQSETLLRRAIELHRRRGDRIAAARATAALAQALLRGERVEAALALLVPASAEFADLSPDPVVVALDGWLARAYASNEEHRSAIEVAERVLDAAEHRDLVEILAATLVTKGFALGSLGRVREGIGVIRAGEELARDNELQAIRLYALVMRGLFQGDIDVAAALDGFREGLALARRVGDRSSMLRFINNVGYTAFLAGDWDVALAELDTGLAEENLERAHRIDLLSNALIVHACRGEPVADGLAELELAIAGDTESNRIAPVEDAKANAALAEGRLDDARVAWRRNAELIAWLAPSSFYQAARPALWDRDVAAVQADLAALDATGFHGRVVEVRRTTIRAGLAALEGRTADALALYREALRGWQDTGLPWDQALTGIDMATLLDPSNPEVRAAAQSARETLVRLGAKPFLARLDAAIGRRTSAESATTAVGESIESRSPTPP